jgi:hypothetical protein
MRASFADDGSDLGSFCRWGVIPGRTVCRASARMPQGASGLN